MKVQNCKYMVKFPISGRKLIFLYNWTFPQFRKNYRFDGNISILNEKFFYSQYIYEYVCKF